MSWIAPMLFAAALGSAQTVPAAPASDAPRPRSSVWVVPWDEFPVSQDTLDRCVNQINPFVFAFDTRNAPVLEYPELLARVEQNRPAGTLLVPVIVNDVFETTGRMHEAKSIQLLTQLLNSPELVDKHVQDLMITAVGDNADGLEIDYERVPPALYDNFASFIEKLSLELHKRGKILAVDLEVGPLIVNKERPIAERFWPRLAQSADEIKLMMYYERGEFSDSVGPGNSLAWIADTGRKALAYIPAEKLSLALSLSATDWQIPYPKKPTDRRVQRLHYGQLMDLMGKVKPAAEWSAAQLAPLFHYKVHGQRHEVWFENERSLAEKVKAARQLGARGVALWYLGAAHPDLNKSGLCPK